MPTLPTPIPTPGRPHATAKFTATFDDGAEAKGYLFTNNIAPGKDQVYPGYAWAVTAELTMKGGIYTRPDQIADWPTAALAARQQAGYPGATFPGGWVKVQPNPAHGTGAAEIRFASPSQFWPAIETAMTQAGWTIITKRPEPPAPVPPVPADADVVALLRDIAALITKTLG
jgi:hypothetical protein